jgi:hypothetical protein
VVDFYDRGGDFFDENFHNMHTFIGELDLSEDDKNALVSFLL